MNQCGKTIGQIELAAFYMMTDLIWQRTPKTYMFATKEVADKVVARAKELLKRLPGAPGDIEDGITIKVLEAEQDEHPVQG